MCVLSAISALVVTDFHNEAPENEHLPILNNIDGILDLLSLCWLVIMGNVLDSRTYAPPNQSAEQPSEKEQKRRLRDYDLNNITLKERLNMAYARGIAYCLVGWLDAHYAIVDVDEPSEEHPSFGTQFIAKESAKLISFARLAQEVDFIALGFATLPAIIKQVDNVMQDPVLKSAWKDASSHTRSTDFTLGLSEYEKSRLKVVRRQIPLLFEGQSILHYFISSTE